MNDDLKYNYWKADHSALRETLSQVNWNAELESKCVNDMWKSFLRIITDCTVKCLPLHSQKAGKQKLPWISKKTRVAMRRRRKAWIAYSKNKSSKLFNIYKAARNAVVSSIRNDKAQYQKKTG